MNNLTDIAKEMSDKDVLLSFQGVLTESVVTDLLEFAENRLKERNVERPARKRVFMVMLESLQNALKHGGRNDSTANKRTTVALIRRPEGFELLMGNYVLESVREPLEARFKFLKSLSPEELRQEYIRILADGKQSDLGGSGLGLMEIARKAGRPIEYNIGEADEKGVCYFTLNVMI